jgi:PTS system galactitol-specific IIB component
MKRKVIVACGGAVATSTMAAEEIKELCADHNIELDLVQCRVNEIETYMDGADLICTTARVEDLWRHSGGTRHAIRFGRRH